MKNFKYYPRYKKDKMGEIIYSEEDQKEMKKVMREIKNTLDEMKHTQKEMWKLL